MLELKNQILSKIYDLPTYTVDQICEAYLPLAERIRPHMAETTHLLNTALADGKSVLFEGAQGTMLDIDHGTYPFVTSIFLLCRWRTDRYGCWPEGDRPRARHREGLHYTCWFRPLPD